ncbi:pentapeptide repeat-containing protein [Actinoallomurus acanthiterrae]
MVKGLQSGTRPKWRAAAGILAATIAVLALLTFLFWPLADAIAEHDARHVPAAQRAEKLQAARDDARGRLVQILAGLLATGGFIYTARNFALARQQSELNRMTLELATLQAQRQHEDSRRALEQSEAVQLTDRFAKAIDQLGGEAIDIRLGAIYSLERIARDSPRDHPAVMEVLAAFVRRTSQARGEEVPQDLQAAMTVLARRSPAADQGRITLRDAKLARLDLSGAAMAGADLAGADLTGARLTGADLTGADLTGGRLEQTLLDSAQLRTAVLTDAVLTGARSPGADLTDADLTRADLTRATLTGATLSGVRAAGAVLRGADLTETDLSSADLSATDLTLATMRRCLLPGAVLSRATLSQVRAENADLSTAKLDDAVLSDARLSQADLRGADLTEANLSGARLDGAMLGDADLGRVRLVGLDLTGAIVSSGARLPTGWSRGTTDGRVHRAA